MAKKPGERLLRRRYKASKGLQRWRKSWAGGSSGIGRSAVVWGRCQEERKGLVDRFNLADE